MTLSQIQVDEVMNILKTSSLDPQIKLDVQTILEQCVPPATPSLNSTTYDDIKAYCAAYKDTLEAMGTGIAQPNYEDDMMLVYMDRSSVVDLLNYVPDDGYVAAVLGIYENAASQNQVTVSLLATDNNKDFIKDKDTNLPISGMENWPKINILQNFDSVFS